MAVWGWDKAPCLPRYRDHQIFRHADGEFGGYCSWWTLVYHTPMHIKHVSRVPNPPFCFTQRGCIRLGRLLMETQTMSDSNSQPNGIPAFITACGTLEISSAQKECLDMFQRPIAQHGRLQKRHRNIIVLSCRWGVFVDIKQPVGSTQCKDHI